MNKHLIKIKEIKEIKILLSILDDINNLKIKIHPLVGLDFNLIHDLKKISPLKEKDYKLISKTNFINLLKDPEEWMSYDMIRLYSGKKLVVEAILHEDEIYVSDNSLYIRLKELKN